MGSSSLGARDARPGKMATAVSRENAGAMEEDMIKKNAKPSKVFLVLLLSRGVVVVFRSHAADSLL